MGVAKVEYYGEVLINLENDTVDKEHLVRGYTAHGADGEPIVGEYDGSELPVLTNPATSGRIVSGYEAIDGSGVKITGTFAGQTKSATPSASAQTITPDSGKYLTSVSVGAIQTETKSGSPGRTAVDVNASSGKYMTKVTIAAIPYQETELTGGGTAVKIGT